MKLTGKPQKPSPTYSELDFFAPPFRGILHPDNWCEVPGGEAQLGLTSEQAKKVWLYSPEGRTENEMIQAMQDEVEARIRNSKHGTAWLEKSIPYNLVSSGFNYSPIPARIVTLPTFYMSRCQITGRQMSDFMKYQMPAEQIRGITDMPRLVRWRQHTWGKWSIFNTRNPFNVTNIHEVFAFCEHIRARLPTADEWEKAARGTDGRLYPWGDEWDESRGFFYYGQPLPDDIDPIDRDAVDAYPRGASPYGVLGMAGGLPERVYDSPKGGYPQYLLHGARFSGGLKGFHPKESSASLAHHHHLVANRNDQTWIWVAFRPMLEKWPRQQWRGVDAAAPPAARPD
ncbi:MAG: formylglycine-generating enzyme family protein [Pleurocapsa minor GSE-CHR-MK-17-07R]|jgi:formylglycine-generating enzyme required for sulfatase activity|nr:formylglycine-generating enzyme family protein [Pleurocapsa minor GSE-CHR-MK 17-07R]